MQWTLGPKIWAWWSYLVGWLPRWLQVVVAMLGLGWVAKLVHLSMQGLMWLWPTAH
jgi:pheromone shutdown protein TraB